jgi:phospholipid/cholesterol/gamma-HCH transport system substrate-binding protein
MQKVAANVQEVTSELQTMVAGSQGSIRQIIENLSRLSANIDRTVTESSGRVTSILDHTDRFTSTLAQVAEADRDRYRAIARNIEQASARLDALLKSVQQVVGPAAGDGGGESELNKTIADARQSIARLNHAVEEVDKIASAVGEGKSVAGKLLVDERLGTKVSGTLEGATDYVDRLVKLKLKVDLRSEWLLNQSGAKTYAGFALVPRPDKYYLLQVVNDPRGYTTQSIQRIASQTPTGTTASTTTITTTEQRFVFSLEFAKRYGPLTMRIGLIESSGGVGADLHLLDDALKISLDVFQFARPDQPPFPRAKLWVDYTLFKHVYLTVGTDDFLNSWQAGRYPGGPKFALGQDVFFGGGIAFTDDDLKAIIGAAGSAITGGAANAR